MNLTDYHTKYFAYELTKRRSSDSVEKLAGGTGRRAGDCDSSATGLNWSARNAWS
jgi:hypothetical protein